jgi:hypothetical protein
VWHEGRKGVVHTLPSRFMHIVDPYLKDSVLPPVSYKHTINAIHTSVVSKNQKSLVSKFLGKVPTEISKQE